jgi:hypothetical protein
MLSIDDLKQILRLILENNQYNDPDDCEIWDGVADRVNAAILSHADNN